MSEAHPKNIKVYNRDCTGCKRYGKDIMIAISIGDLDILDVFLTQDQAEKLQYTLGVRLKQNEENND